MKEELKARLIGLIQRDADRLARAWEQRFDSHTIGEALWVCEGRLNPGFILVRDLLGVLSEDPHRSFRWPTMSELQEENESGFWQIGLCRGIEIFLEGEEMIQEWAMDKLNLTDGEKVDLFEIINLAFHQLFQLYAQKYCESCQSALAQPHFPGVRP